MSKLKVLTEIGVERSRQDAKWGEQNHPDADEVILSRLDGTDWARTNVAVRLADEYEIPTAARARTMCKWRAEQERVTWADILVEEVSELIEAIASCDPAQVRAEAVQVAAVAVAWVEAIDRRSQDNEVAP